jgi:hypothetical protein
MKNIRHINIRNTAIAIVAVAGVAVAITACSRNSSTDSASKALETTIETATDQPESAAKVTSPAAVSSVSGKVGSPAASSSAPSTATPSTATPLTDSPSTDAPASAEVDPILESAGTETDPSIETEETAADPSTEAPDTTTPDSATPDTTTPASASPTIPGIVLSPTISFVTFAQDGVTINTSILVEEAGLGRNDIVSVEFTYTKFGTERTVTATKASSTTTSSLWLVESLMLPVGSTVKIHAVDARGNSDDITKTVVLSTAMG